MKKMLAAGFTVGTFTALSEGCAKEEQDLAHVETVEPNTKFECYLKETKTIKD